jgi:hypothetical protein
MGAGLIELKWVKAQADPVDPLSASRDLVLERIAVTSGITVQR